MLPDPGAGVRKGTSTLALGVGGTAHSSRYREQPLSSNAEELSKLHDPLYPSDSGLSGGGGMTTSSAYEAKVQRALGRDRGKKFRTAPDSGFDDSERDVSQKKQRTMLAQ